MRKDTLYAFGISFGGVV